MIVDFCADESASIKSFAIKKNDQVKVTTRFLSAKMLMFAKLPLMSFIYEMLETFCFPDEKVQKIYDKYLIEKVHINHVLTDTGSTCLQVIFISNPKSEICGKKKQNKNVIFEVIIASEIYNRFYSFHEYWEKFSARQENVEAILGSKI